MIDVLALPALAVLVLWLADRGHLTRPADGRHRQKARRDQDDSEDSEDRHPRSPMPRPGPSTIVRGLPRDERSGPGDSV